MLQGWISVHRQIQDHWLWADKPFSKGQAWIDMLMLANHEDSKVLLGDKVFDIKEGGFITSETKLGERWGWSRKKVHSFLDLLIEERMVEAKRDNKRTAVFVINYTKYRYRPTAEEPQKNIKSTAEEPQKNTNNNVNNANNENKERIDIFSPPHCGKVENSVPELDIDFHHHRLHDRYGIDVTREEVGKLMRELPDIDRVYQHFGIIER